MGKLRDFGEMWWEYLESYGIEGLKEDVVRDVEEVGFIIVRSVKMVGNGLRFIGGCIVIVLEVVGPAIWVIIEITFLIINFALFILDKLMMGFLSIWDSEEYKKIQNEQWKRKGKY